MDERNVIARDEATVILTGIFKIDNIMGTRIKAPPAPKIPDTPPMINAGV